MVRLLTNPVMLRFALLSISSASAFALAIVAIRRLRRNLVREASLDAAGATMQGVPVHLYGTVIQQLKQQKHELQVQSISEQRRARTTENFSQTVLSNLPSGVLVFGLNGLVKQANTAAKEILGFRSLPGMSPEDVFRDAAVSSEHTSAFFSDGLEDLPGRVVEEVHAVLLAGGKRRQIEADYNTPSGEKLHLAVTISPISSLEGELLGVACLISDRSEIERIRRQQQLRGEISAEMALQLRTSLTTISGYAQQLAGNREPAMAQQLAADIAAEAASLDRRIGGFLAEKHYDIGKLAKGVGRAY